MEKQIELTITGDEADFHTLLRLLQDVKTEFDITDEEEMTTLANLITEIEKALAK